MMKTFLLSLICLFLFETTHLAFANEVCNKYVDDIIEDMKQDKEVFIDPYVIPEKTIEVSKKIIFVNYSGEAGIYDGYIFGMSTLHRDSDVVVDKSKQIHLKLWLGAGELSMKCSGKIKLMGHGPKVSINAVVKYVNMKLDMVPTKDSNPKIVNFKLESVKGTDIKVKGLGPLGFFLEKYVELIGKIFKGLIKQAVEARLKDFLSKKMKDYVIPQECLDSVASRSLNF